MVDEWAAKGFDVSSDIANQPSGMSYFYAQGVMESTIFGTTKIYK